MKVNKKYKTFEDLSVWRKAKDLVLEIYRCTKSFPKEELYSLTSQIRRSALSITANIAEGFGRYHYLDKNKFYYNARGSLEELRSHLIISKELLYVSSDIFFELNNHLNEISEELNKVIFVTKKQIVNKSN